MKKVILLFAILIAFASQNEAKATHIQGINVQYKHLNGDTFLVMFDFFRYCGGTLLGGTGTPAGAPTVFNYTLYCPDVGFSQSRTVSRDTLKEATPLCDAYPSTCDPSVPSSGGILGIEWAYLTDTLVFGDLAVSSCSEWTIYYSTGARNNGTNYPSQPSIAVFTKFAQQEDPTNSSVQFDSPKPIPFFCDGQQVTYNWGAVELDGDSLYWELDTAADGYNTITGPQPMNYNAGYSGVQPMPGVTIDHATGELSFTAQIPPGLPGANYAIAVKVTEYDPNTGNYKGMTQRDVQFVVTDSCANNPPTQDTNGISNFQGSGALLGPNTVEVCFGQNFEFETIFADYDTAGNISSDSINVTCNIASVLPGATWSHTGTNPDTVTVSWTAVPTPIRFAPFNITVEDDNCPITSFNIYNLIVRITPSTILPEDTAICSIDTIMLNTIGGDTFTYEVIPDSNGNMGPPLVATGSNPNIECNPCYGGHSPWIKLDTTVRIRVESNLSATCGNADTIDIQVFDKFPIQITPAHGGTPGGLAYCETDGLDTLNGYTPGGTWLGSGIVNTVDGVFAPDVFNLSPGEDTIVNIVYKITSFCPNSDTVPILVKGKPDASVTTVGPYCVQQSIVKLAGPDSTGVWSGPNVTPGGILDPSAFAGADTTILVYHNVNDSGCVALDSAYIPIVDEFSSRIDSLPKICSGEEILLNLVDYQGDPGGVWTGDNVIDDSDSSGNYYFDTKGLRAGNYSITYSIPGECGSSNDTVLVINPLPDASIFGADSVYCDNIKDSVLLTSATERGIWGGSMTELHDGYFIPYEVGEGVYEITYELYDTVTSCYNKNIVPVRIARTPVSPKLYGGGPYCQGESIQVRGDGLLSNTYKWFGVSENDSVLLGAGNPFKFGEVVDMPTIIYGTQVSKYGCESPTSRLEVEVLSTPEADFTVDTTFGNVPLLVTVENLSGPDSSDLSFSWSTPFETLFIESSTNENAFDPITFEIDEIGTYPITLVVDNGRCDSEKTINVTADRITKFFIPNVFTPNGDGENDELVWKIEGIGDFKLTIYNRWGNKVYATEDASKFWDGGEEPSGPYFYVMTGKENTLSEERTELRGNITLIRK